MGAGLLKKSGEPSAPSADIQYRLPFQVLWESIAGNVASDVVITPLREAVVEIIAVIPVILFLASCPKFAEVTGAGKLELHVRLICQYSWRKHLSRYGSP